MAAAWCALMHLGEEGYMEIARTLMGVTDRLTAGIDAIPVRAQTNYEFFSFLVVFA